ncbi:MAG: hypothetical protein V7664_13685 [Qipengyuania sp.]|uniref:hypothetical protein n=1 Tax=Qipengyuania sp. TaxID=2004515 RepID=UPI00300290D7
MAERVLWNFYDVQQVKEGGHMIVQRRCVDKPSPNAIANYHGMTTLHAYRTGKLEAQEEASRRNAELGEAHVPYPFNLDEE